MTGTSNADEVCPTASAGNETDTGAVTWIVAATLAFTHVFAEEPGAPGAGCGPLLPGCAHWMNVFVTVQLTLQIGRAHV